MKHRFFILICLILLTFGLIYAQTTNKKSSRRNVTIGLIGKISTNHVFIAAYSGARVAAKELGAKYNIQIDIDWQTPAQENVHEQGSAIERLSRSGADGIAIACSDANYLTPIIDNAVDNGIPIMCFDSDAPSSKRFAYYGADDVEFGKAIMRQLVAEIEGNGTIAVLAGNKNALNQQLRLKGIKEELKKHPNISLPAANIYHNIEIPGPSAELVRREQKAKPNIVGWAFQGSWSLLVKNSITWKPGSVKVVAGNAVQAELEYVKSGHVQSLVGVNCFQMGYKTVELLLDKILNNKAPAEPQMFIPLTPVTKENVEEWSLNWRKWLLKEALYR
jgi:ribose transport system substrate-binding protein